MFAIVLAGIVSCVLTPVVFALSARFSRGSSGTRTDFHGVTQVPLDAGLGEY